MLDTYPLKNRSLHVLADANKYAYVICIFIRNETEESMTRAFLRAKNGIIPFKIITIPSLQFLVCLSTARLAAKVFKDMKRPDIETYY